MQKPTFLILAFAATLVGASAIDAQSAVASQFPAEAQVLYRTVPNITYLTANN
jgi:hypothetical protein